MGSSKIEGVEVYPLKQIKDERGMVMHMMRSDSPYFKNFGEIYFSQVNGGVIKGWKKHKEMTQNFSCPSGKIRVVLYDDRNESKTKGKVDILDFGVENYNLVTIPPGIWYSFSSLSESPSIIANCTDMPHRPSESEARPLSDFDHIYRWSM